MKRLMGQWRACKMLSLNQKKLLSIDNDESTLTIVQIALEVTANWQVLSAQGGQQGLTLAMTEQPDTILLDLLMPEMDGLHTLKALRANPLTTAIPIILFTGRPDLAEQLRQSGNEVQGIIAKPFDVLTLAKQVAEFLTW